MQQDKVDGPITGRKRRMTRRSVVLIDRAMKWIITIGGISVVVAFAAIVLYIVSVVVPMFKSPAITPAVVTQLPIADAAATTQSVEPEGRVAVGLDEELVSLWTLDRSCELSIYRIAGGERIRRTSLHPRPASAMNWSRNNVSLGFDDGTVRVGRVKQEVEFVNAGSDALDSLEPGQTAVYEDAVALKTPIGQYRIVRLKPEFTDPITVGEEPSPIRLVDYVYSDNLEAYVALRDDHTLYFGTISKKYNMMTRKWKVDDSSFQLPLPIEYHDKKPVSLLLGLNARLVFLLFNDGTLLRYSTDTPFKVFIAEVQDVLLNDQLEITVAQMLLGELTLIIADSSGALMGWFPAPFIDGETRTTSDGLRMVKAHVLDSQGSPVTVIATSSRDRQFITGDVAGNVWLRHMTSGTTQAKLAPTDGRTVVGLAIGPQNNAIAVLDDSRKLNLLSMHNPHADGSMAQLFSPIHYEGYAEPGFIYQSSAGTDDAELKFSLFPLIWGTLKATLYAMLFAVPVAIMAAIYSSEFMQPQVRAVIKPTIELMASLPSVVLGFIGALVVAPYVENLVPAMLGVIISVPVGVALFGFLWQALPPQVTRAAPPWLSFTIMFGVVIATTWTTFACGPLIERFFFAGDFAGWAARRVGSPTSGWVILLTPLLAVGLSLAFNAYAKPHISLYREGTRATVATFDLFRFLAIGGASLGAAFFLGLALGGMGLDIRADIPFAGNLVGPYVQRNSLLVGIFMGFAIIPIIYTVSEDALNSVPNTLRSASLGAGATPWQTAIRVVLPVATSGIFSACMIGFGRAAGETMIVLMMSGRTPIIDLNLFNGLSALSANIATELPEAAVNSTHFRVLFLSALVLFAITFVVNTAAEVIRIRFRKRAFQL